MTAGAAFLEPESVTPSRLRLRGMHGFVYFDGIRLPDEIHPELMACYDVSDVQPRRSARWAFRRHGFRLNYETITWRED